MVGWFESIGITRWDYIVIAAIGSFSFWRSGALFVFISHCYLLPSEGELESTINELEESNRKLAILKAERDGAKGATFPVLNRGGKQVTSDKGRDKQRDLQDMESTLRDLLVSSYSVFSLV